MMLIAASIGTDVNSADTSYEVMVSSAWSLTCFWFYFRENADLWSYIRLQIEWETYIMLKVTCYMANKSRNIEVL